MLVNSLPLSPLFHVDAHLHWILFVCSHFEMQLWVMDASGAPRIANAEDARLFQSLLTGIYSAYDGSVPDVEEIRTVLSMMEVKPATLDQNQAEILGSVLGGLLSGSIIRTSGDLLRVEQSTGNTVVKTSFSSLIPAGTIASLISGIIAGVLESQSGSSGPNGCLVGYPLVGYPVYPPGYPPAHPGYPAYTGYYPPFPAGSLPPTGTLNPTTVHPGSYPSYPGYYPFIPGGAHIPEVASGHPGSYPSYPGYHPLLPVANPTPPSTTTSPLPSAGSPIPDESSKETEQTLESAPAMSNSSGGADAI